MPIFYKKRLTDEAVRLAETAMLLRMYLRLTDAGLLLEPPQELAFLPLKIVALALGYKSTFFIRNAYRLPSFPVELHRKGTARCISIEDISTLRRYLQVWDKTYAENKLSGKRS